MQAHEIVNQVQSAYKGIAAKLALFTGKSEELFRSHGREPKSRNPLQSGNVSPVTAYIEYVHKYQAAHRGAGQTLNARVHASLNAEFAECDMSVSAIDLHENLIDEHCDVQKWLARFQMDTATAKQLAVFELECDEAMDALLAAKARARSAKRLKESSRNLQAVG